MYTAIFDGLRSYYASYQSRRTAAGFHAAMTMSFLFSITTVSAVTLADYFINGRLHWSVALFANKLLSIVVGVVIAYGHVQFGKQTGRYNSLEPVRAPHWKSYLWTYVIGATALFIGAIRVALTA